VAPFDFFSCSSILRKDVTFFPQLNNQNGIPAQLMKNALSLVFLYKLKRVGAAYNVQSL
jgi:hypothetical protein